MSPPLHGPPLTSPLQSPKFLALHIPLYFKVLAAIEGGYDVGTDASHRVIHQDGDRETFQEGKVQFATDHVASLFMAQCMSRGTAARLLRDLASPLNTSSSSRGQFFELLMHPIICSGGTFDFRFVDVPSVVPPDKGKGRPTTISKNAMEKALKSATSKELAAQGSAPGLSLQLTIQTLEEVIFRGGMQADLGDFCAAVKGCSSPAYLRPDNAVHSAIDACIWPDTLLNFKVLGGKSDSPSEVLLEQHLHCLPDLPQYFFDYVVPSDVFASFKPTCLQRDAGKFPRLSRLNVRVVKAMAAGRSVSSMRGRGTVQQAARLGRGTVHAAGAQHRKERRSMRPHSKLAL